MLEQWRANWIASPERELLLAAVENKLAARIAELVPDHGIARMSVELAHLVIVEVDGLIAKPIEVDANTITITDHRG